MRPWRDEPIRPSTDQLTLRGGICGCARKATPVSPKSARQIAFQVGCADRRLALQQRADVHRRRGDHRFDHETGLRHADGDRRRADRGDRHADADAEHVRERRIALVLVDDDEAAGIGQLLDASDRADAAERGQHHRIGERQFVGLADRAVVGDLLDRHFALLDILDAGVGDPLDVLLAHLAFEQALGVADAVEAEVADIGL